MSQIRVRQEDLAWREVSEDVVVLDERTQKYLQLSGTGALLWPALVDGTTPDALAAQLCSTFGIDEATARRDVDAFVGDLLARELVEDVSA